MRLRDLDLLARLGLSGLVLVLLGGLAASVGYIYQHHAPRDGRPQFAYDDLVGVYHGIERPSSLVTALQSGHPEGLDPSDRELLLGWLASDRISEDYDNLDLGEASPAEVIDRACLQCHARKSDDPAAAALPLEYWDDVEALAYSYEVAALPPEILVVTTHTHALALGTLGLVTALLVLATRFSRRLVGALVAACGLGLLLDLASWWLARDSAALVAGVVLGGALLCASLALQLVLVLLDLWLPARDGAALD